VIYVVLELRERLENVFLFVFVILFGESILTRSGLKNGAHMYCNLAQLPYFVL